MNDQYQVFAIDINICKKVALLNLPYEERMTTTLCYPSGNYFLGYSWNLLFPSYPCVPTVAYKGRLISHFNGNRPLANSSMDWIPAQNRRILEH